MALGVSLRSDIDTCSVRLFRWHSATNIQTEFESVMSDAKQKLTQSAGMIPEPMQGLMTVATQTLRFLQGPSSGSEVDHRQRASNSQ